ncbi:MAG: PRC-barrel domain-containing protein, partial [Candidatus Limnocylindrales bacterium]
MLYLSQAIGRPVRDRQDDQIGKVADLIVAIGDRYPPVTGLVMSTGRRRTFLPWSDVQSFDESGAKLRSHTLDIDRFEQRPNELLLFQDLQDKQNVDIDGRKVVRVNDLRLDHIEGKLHLVAVDVGAAGILRRIGFEGPFRIIARNLHLGVPERYIDWE